MRISLTPMLTLVLGVAMMAQTPAPTTPPAKPATAPPKPAAPKPAAPKPAAAKPAAAKPPTTDDEQAIYALGLTLYSQFDLSPAEVEILKRGILDAANKTPVGKLEDWGPKITPLAQARRMRAVERGKAASVEFLAKAAAEPFNVKTPSGVVYREITSGTGPMPKATDTVKVNYRGTLIDGTEFDSSYKRNEPATFPLNGVIKCWTEGVQMMKVGGKARLVCPSDLAYGDQGRPGIPPAAVLVFEIELLEIVNSPQPAGSR
jgi:FKBP-type peptidyl-prolyl cis-trans isomerase FkpA